VTIEQFKSIVGNLEELLLAVYFVGAFFTTIFTIYYIHKQIER